MADLEKLASEAFRAELDGIQKEAKKNLFERLKGGTQKAMRTVRASGAEDLMDEATRVVGAGAGKVTRAHRNAMARDPDYAAWVRKKVAGPEPVQERAKPAHLAAAGGGAALIGLGGGSLLARRNRDDR